MYSNIEIMFDLRYNLYMSRSKKKNKSTIYIIILIIALIVAFYEEVVEDTYSIPETILASYDIDNIPEYSGYAFVYINGNIPFFEDKEKNAEGFEIYGDLDRLGRCTYAFANISKNLMPTEKRSSIGSVRPSGWQISKYDFIDGKYLYNRCHLIGYQLTGENANENNLITCTRQMNTGTMLEYENKVAEYIKRTGNHVLYRVTPVFEENNLLAKGVIMEGLSVEDKEIEFNIFVYNVQDGVIIDYSNGDNYPE